MNNICESKIDQYCNTVIRLKSAYIDLLEMGIKKGEIFELLEGQMNGKEQRKKHS